MNNSNETIADIAAEMRRGTKLPGYWSSCDLNKILQYNADRIEEAWKRERSQSWHHREIEELVSRHEEELSDARKLSGNAAAMREALSDACYAMFNFLKTQNGGYEEMANALDKAKAALAKPPRNCDVGTAEEQEERFKHFCAQNHSACDVDMECCRCPIEREKADCEFVWAQMPYEKQEGCAK